LLPAIGSWLMSCWVSVLRSLPRPVEVTIFLYPKRDSERALGPPQTGADCDDGDHRRSARPVRARAACSPSACSIALPLPDELCATARMADARNRLGDQSFPLVGRTGFAIMTRLRSFKAISFDDGFEIHFASAPIGSEPSRC